ncbi:polyprenyl synthetase family protein [Couchioplanes caeruleus]|uniref:polyprenyl synthetase family protein n=1 Tax=Couchioplanes caeruleus TaxID=56438 RepID=UPI0020BEF5EF|nr:polyprenyl synthetase family protein [Couchioplanes caeruleus]UQU67704.1 polyprenyl synthetase family protein [Couchioplanes caeruleus]
MTIAPARIPGVAASWLAAVEEGLAERVAGVPEPLTGPCRRIVTAPAKRLRPTLVLSAAACAGGGLTPATLGSAVAVELLHCSSLVHDDLIDAARARRGVPTVNGAEGAATAIVAGDALIALAGEVAAAVDARTAAAVSSTLSELCRGEARELAGRYRAGLSLAEVIGTIEAKTGALLRVACRLGAEAAGADPRLTAALDAFGLSFGTCLQLVDDVLDVVSTDDLLGKPTGADFAAGTVTAPAVHALAASPELRTLLRPGLDDHERRRVRSLLCEHGVGAAVALARDLARRSERTLTAAAGLGDDPTVRALAALPGRYVRRQLTTRVPPQHRHLLPALP